MCGSIFACKTPLEHFALSGNCARHLFLISRTHINATPCRLNHGALALSVRSASSSLRACAQACMISPLHCFWSILIALFSRFPSVHSWTSSVANLSFSHSGSSALLLSALYLMLSTWIFIIRYQMWIKTRDDCLSIIFQCSFHDTTFSPMLRSLLNLHRTNDAKKETEWTQRFERFSDRFWEQREERKRGNRKLMHTSAVTSETKACFTSAWSS